MHANDCHCEECEAGAGLDIAMSEPVPSAVMTVAGEMAKPRYTWFIKSQVYPDVEYGDWSLLVFDNGVECGLVRGLTSTQARERGAVVVAALNAWDQSEQAWAGRVIKGDTLAQRLVVDVYFQEPIINKADARG